MKIDRYLQISPKIKLTIINYNTKTVHNCLTTRIVGTVGSSSPTTYIIQNILLIFHKLFLKVLTY